MIKKETHAIERPIIFFLIFSVSMYFFAVDFYAPALPKIQTELQISYHQIQWTMSLFAIGFFIPQLLFGALVTYYKKRTLLLYSSAFFLVASLLCATTSYIEVIYIGRLMQGIACSAIYVIGFATTRELIEQHRLKIVMPISSIGYTVISAISPLIGGYIIQQTTWQMIFIAMAAISLLLLILTYYFYPTITPIKQPIGHRPNLSTILRNYRQLLHNFQFTVSAFISISAVVGMIIFYQIGSFVFIQQASITPTIFGVVCFGLVILSALARVAYLYCLHQVPPLKGIFTWGVVALISALLSYINNNTQILSAATQQTFFIISYAIFIFSLSVIHCYAQVFGFSAASRSKSGYYSALYGCLTSSYIALGSLMASIATPSISSLIVFMWVMTIIIIAGAALIHLKRAETNTVMEAESAEM